MWMKMKVPCGTAGAQTNKIFNLFLKDAWKRCIIAGAENTRSRFKLDIKEKLPVFWWMEDYLQ